MPYDPTEYLGDFSYAVTTVNVSTGPATLLVNSRVERVGLIIINNTGNGVGLATYGNFSLGQSQYLFATGTTLSILWKDVGAIVTYPWYALSVAPSVTVTVTEILYRPLE